MGLGKKIFLVAVLFVGVVNAQVPTPTLPGPPGAPIDFGVVPMIGLAIAYGIKKLRK